MPSTDEGAEAFKKRTRNCSPCVRSLVHSPEAVIHSPAEIVAAWPTAVTRSRWPRALIRSTQKPVSGVVEGDPLDEAGQHLAARCAVSSAGLVGGGAVAVVSGRVRAGGHGRELSSEPVT